MKGYYHEVPNMADDDLDPYSYRLYGHIRRVIGNNGTVCTESIRQLAAACKMSVGKTSAARRDLAERGLIVIEDVPGPGASVAGSRITLAANTWEQNGARYRPAEAVASAPVVAEPVADEHPCSPHEHPCAIGEHPRSHHEHPRSPGERSINNYKESTTRAKTKKHHHHSESSLAVTRPRAAPTHGPVSDDEGQHWGLIFKHIQGWNLQPYARALLRRQDPANALALIWLARDKAKHNPAGYLATLLAQQQAASDEQQHRARVALDLGTGDAAEVERELYRQSLRAVNAWYGNDG